jgi:hypothetical protein
MKATLIQIVFDGALMTLVTARISAWPRRAVEELT